MRIKNKLILLSQVVAFVAITVNCAIAQNSNFSNLKFLKNYNVVMLGEPTHGEGNVVEYKTQLVEYLHDSLGFNTIAFESGFYDLFQAQALIKKDNNGNATPYLKQSIFPVWTLSAEFQPFLKYFDNRKSELKIIGFDNQLTGEYSKADMLDSMLAFIERHNRNGVANKVNADLLQRCITAFSESFSFPNEVRFDDFNKQCKILKVQLNGIRSERKIVWWYDHAIDNLMALGKDYYNNKDRVLDGENFKAKDSNPRDSMMAQNLIAYIQNHPDEKIICWGAGMHFMNNPKENLDHAELQEYKPMGLYVKQAVGEHKVFNLTFISSKGSYATPGGQTQDIPHPEPQSIESRLEGLNKDSLILLKNIKQPFISSCLEYTPVMGYWDKLFDAFFYFPKFAPSHLYTNKADDYQSENNVKKTTSLNKDTFIVGRVIDASSRLPVFYASVIIPNLEYGLFTDDSGRFSIPIRYLKDTIEFHCLGYFTQKLVLNRLQENVIALVIQPNTLNEVVIQGKDQSAKNVIKQIKAHWSTNYETKPFKQQGYNILTIKNYDTLVKSIETVNEYYAFFKNNSIRTQNIDCKEVNAWGTPGLSEVIPSKSLGLFPFMGKVAEPAEIFTQNPFGNYDFKVTKIYEEPDMGTIIVIDYRQKKMNRWLTDTWIVASNTGTLWIREDDYAVLKVTSTIRRDTATLNKWAKKYDGKNLGFGKSKIKLVSPITTYEIGETSTTYHYDKVLKKYFVNYHVEQWRKNGYFQDKDNRPFSMETKNQFMNMGNITTGIDDELSTGLLPKVWYQQVYHPTFWNQFVSPQNSGQNK